MSSKPWRSRWARSRADHVLRILVGHQTEIDLHGTFRRQHRLGSFSRIAAGEAVDVHARREVHRLIEIRVVDALQNPLPARRLNEAVEREGRAGREIAFRLRRRPDGIVEAVDQDASRPVAQRCGRGGKPPEGIVEDGTEARMQIGLRGPAAQLDGHHALEAAEDDGAPARIDLAIFPPADIDPLARKAPLQELLQRRTADLLLAVHQPDQPERQGAGMLLPEQAPACEAADELALVVGDTASVPSSIPLGELERRAVPKRDGILRLDVVVIVDHDGQRPGADLSDDDRGRSPRRRSPFEIRPRRADRARPARIRRDCPRAH